MLGRLCRLCCRALHMMRTDCTAGGVYGVCFVVAVSLVSIHDTASRIQTVLWYTHSITPLYSIVVHRNHRLRLTCVHSVVACPRCPYSTAASTPPTVGWVVGEVVGFNSSIAINFSLYPPRQSSTHTHGLQCTLNPSLKLLYFVGHLLFFP